MFISAGTLFIITIPGLLFLHSDPTKIGEPRPKANPSKEQDDNSNVTTLEILKKEFKSPGKKNF